MNDGEDSKSDGIIDGATGVNDGGREEGDVELAFFKCVREEATASTSGQAPQSKSGEGYSRYFSDPLSMFARQAESSGSDSPPENLTAKDEASSSKVVPPQMRPPPTAYKPAKPRSFTGAPTSRPLRSSEGTSGADVVRVADEEGTDGSESDGTEEDDTDDTEGLHRYVGQGVAWRDAMVKACADLLGKTVTELKAEYEATEVAANAASTAFSSETRSFEPLPRDLADYAIMSTLKMRDAFAMQNATSWLFNMMDRTGAGYVLRDEFIRYAPFIGPVADTAVAGLIFDALVHEQAKRAAEEEATKRKGEFWNWGKKNNGEKKRKEREARERKRESHDGLRRRRRPLPISSSASMEEARAASVDGATNAGSVSTVTNGSAIPTTVVGDFPPEELYPPAVAMRYETWRSYFMAIEDKYHYQDEEWPKVKKLLGIDPGEIIVKSQGALDHSDLFPTLGKLFLSQRYLIFFAAVGRNHYVARLGAVAEVSTSTIPFMMRDCIQIYLESEKKAALDGVTSALPEEVQETGFRAAEDGGKQEENKKDELTLSQHVGWHMRNFTARRKPLQFSLLEFRETRRRDNWVNLTNELVAAHRLHVQLGFGSSGRVVPSVQVIAQNTVELLTTPKAAIAEKEEEKAKEKVSTVNYHRSPFRNEPSPPLLAVAAHANIVRYRALRRVTQKQTSDSLLLFSHSERNSHFVNWYTDSVRAYNNDSGRSWIEKALATIRENMHTNDRMYRIHDSTPFDPQVLGDQIGRFAELCSPLARIVQSIMHLIQWKNPPATILAILVCVVVATKGWIGYVPAALILFQAAWIVETKNNILGLGMARGGFEDAEKRQANVLALVAQVHDTLEAGQNVLSSMNGELGKLQALFLWGAEEWQSWVAVGTLCVVGIVLLLVTARSIFLSMCFFLFFKHFLPPTNPGQKFWEGVPSRITKGRKPTKKKGSTRRRRKASSASLSSTSLTVTPAKNT